MKSADAFHSEIIEMAWSDDTPFDAILRQTGLSEGDVIKIMRAHLKPSSFRLWRKRVSGRHAKHEQLGKEKGSLSKNVV